MRRSLKVKLILSYLAVALLTVLVVSVLLRLNSGRSLMNMVVEEETATLTQAVQDYYTANGSLAGFYEDYTSADNRPPQPGGDNKPANKRDIRGVDGLVDTAYQAVIPSLGYAVGETVPESKITQKTTVEADGETIAYIIPDTSLKFTLNPEEKLFLQRTNTATAAAAVAGVIAAVAMGFFLTSRLLKPIRLLTRASQALAQGDLDQQVPVTSQDELGTLTTTFNQMSADLVKADEQRKRITADITHDLSTPLQIISGYIEMLEAGEVTLTPQRLEIIKTEIGHLRRLVSDLSTLTQVESGALDIQVQPVQPEELLERVFNAYQPIAAQKGVALSLTLDASGTAAASVLVDEGRMLQVLKNLVENALRYTSSGGTIQLGLRAGDRVQLMVKDSGEGIDAEDLPYVFDRFYRADKSRGANSGKMGLGLAICKALVTAQGGEISAESAGKGMGTTMVITLRPV